MIIVDYSGIAFSNIVMLKHKADESLLRHMILNTIRMYNVQNRKKYGKMVIALDGRSWRRNVFEYYKARRREAIADAAKDEAAPDWPALFAIINSISADIQNHFPWKVVHHQGAEADDVISTLTEEFAASKIPTMIISADKDFGQLQRLPLVDQFSPITKKRIKIDDPERLLFEHICRGDGGDGVPNILSPDNTFVSNIRQKPMTAKRIEELYENRYVLDKKLNAEEFRNFERNKLLIDLRSIPAQIRSEILDIYNSQPEVPNSSVLPYLIKHKMRNMIPNAADFFHIT